MTLRAGAPRLRAMQTGTDNTHRPVCRSPSPFLWAVLLSTPLLLIVLAVVAGEESILDRAVRLAFRPLCHQDPERSFLVHGAPLAVCVRCTGFYGGLALVALLGAGVWQAGLRWRVPGAAFLLILPLAADGAGNFLQLWSSGPTVRVLTGVAAALPLALAITGMNHDIE